MKPKQNNFVPLWNVKMLNGDTIQVLADLMKIDDGDVDICPIALIESQHKAWKNYCQLALNNINDDEQLNSKCDMYLSHIENVHRILASQLDLISRVEATNNHSLH